MVSSSSQGGISQVLSETYQAESTYTLTATVARTSATSSVSYFSLGLEDDGGNVLNSRIVLPFSLPMNTYTEVSVEVTIASGSSAVGQNVHVDLFFSGSGTSVAVDEISLCKS